MDLSMILNNDGGGYESSPPPSPARSPVRASTRWSVDEMRSAVAILSDFHPPHDRDDDETEDEQARHRHNTNSNTQRAPEEPKRGFSGLDLLFQADAIIQKRVSPELRPAKAVMKKRKTSDNNNTSKKNARPQPIATATDTVDEDDDDEEPDSSPKYMRSGFWTRAEEEYAAALIFYFLRGALPIAEGTTLRKYLAEQLCCNRRRVSMKLATETIADKKIPRKVGASVFVALKPTPNKADRAEVEAILGRLRRDCFREMEAQLERKTSGQEPTSDVPVSPLLLSAKKHFKNEPGSPSDVSLGTPSRSRKSPKKQRRPSVSSTSSKPSPPHIKRRRPLIIRTGFDSPQEEEYVKAMVEYFTEGTLELNEDMRLVTYLCEQLECSPKILSMKLAPRKMGKSAFPENLGSLTFTRKEEEDVSSEIFEAEAHVFELRQNWLQAREEAEQAQDESEPEEKPALATPVLTPARKVKTETTPVSSTRAATPPHVKKEKESPTYARSGPWSRHEEEFAAGLIDCFFRGVLDITEGTTLRAYLTSRLKCNPMRISKKLASHTIADVKIPKKLGSATYVQRDGVSEEERRSADEHLQHLEHLSQSEQHLKEDLFVRVIGTKHGRDDELEENEQQESMYSSDAQPRGLFHHRSHSYEHHEYEYERDQYQGRHTSHAAGPISPRSPFRVHRHAHAMDDYAAPPQHTTHRRTHSHARPSSSAASYDHRDASMRYQRVAY